MEDTIKLFELVVYPTTEKVYYKKWESLKKLYIERQINLAKVTYDEGLKSFENAYRNVYNWGYNKICGFILIFYDIKAGDIKFHIYKQKYNHYNKNVKLRLEWLYGPNLRDYVRGKSNEEIISIIDVRLNYIKKYFFKNNYIDLDCYNNLKCNIDFAKIVQGSD